MKLTRLFSPLQIKSMTLKNRIIMPAIHHLYTPDGHATDRFNRYYWRRAEGGAALIFVGGCRFDDYGGAASMMSLQRDEFIPGYREFTDGMHRRGALVGVQLYHAGAYALRSGIPGQRQALAPSDTTSRFTREPAREITPEEIRQVQRDWAAGARRAKQAGFDVVEIIGSAGYLISQFLSPLRNKRTDEYGGTWENRTRFARELVAAVREAVGPDYPISMRVSGNDFVPGSNTGAEAVGFCRIMEQCGVDMLNVTGGWHESVVPQITGDLPAGGFAYLAAAVREAVGIPVAASNRIGDPVLAEKLLATGAADLVSVGRHMIADPDWAEKARLGRWDEIRYCVACNQGCLAKTFFGKPIECLVNGMAGREYKAADRPCEAPKRILVVGAGPAGSEFAIEAARRGHSVELWEEEREIGGQLHLVAAPPGKQEFKKLIDYYRTMLEKRGVTVRLGRTADSQSVVTGNFDAVVVATGMCPNVIELPGDGSVPVVSAYDVLRDEAIPGRHVVVIGGGSVGCETAQYLARDAGASPGQIAFLLEHQAETTEKIQSLINHSRRTISIVDIDKVGSGFDPGTGWPVMRDLRRLGVRQYPFSRILDIEDGVLHLSVADSDEGGERRIAIPCDTIVLSVGASPNDALYRELAQQGVTVHALGDTYRVGKVIDAVRQADELAAAL